MNVTKMLLTPNKYSRPQTPLKKVTKIAVHYVGNAGSSAKGNRNYFENLKNGSGTYASSHYIVGLEGEIIQCIPEDEISYATNSANSYSISIECCHPDASGKFNGKTLTSLKWLCADLCKRHNLSPTADIIRHYDVTGKKCPLYWVSNPSDFTKFKKSVTDFINGGIDMEELKRLQQQIDKLQQAIENNTEKTFDTIDDVPQWGKKTVQKLIDKGAIKGDGRDMLDLSYTLLRLLVINDRMGLYD